MENKDKSCPYERKSKFKVIMREFWIDLSSNKKDVQVKVDLKKKVT